MPYQKFTKYEKGVKYYAARNTRNGKVTKYTSDENRETGIKMREMYSHGWQPKGLAAASHSTRQRVSSIGGRSSRR